jgi:hypothetical protein
MSPIQNLAISGPGFLSWDKWRDENRVVPRRAGLHCLRVPHMTVLAIGGSATKTIVKVTQCSQSNSKSNWSVGLRTAGRLLAQARLFVSTRALTSIRPKRYDSRKAFSLVNVLFFIEKYFAGGRRDHAGEHRAASLTRYGSAAQEFDFKVVRGVPASSFAVPLAQVQIEEDRRADQFQVRLVDCSLRVQDHHTGSAPGRNKVRANVSRHHDLSTAPRVRTGEVASRSGRWRQQVSC